MFFILIDKIFGHLKMIFLLSYFRLKISSFITQEIIYFLMSDSWIKITSNEKFQSLASIKL